MRYIYTHIKIEEYNGTFKEKHDVIRFICDVYKDIENILICAEAHVSEKDFPPHKYYNPYMYAPNSPKAKGKKPVPYKDVLVSETNVLEHFGFVSINDNDRFHCEYRVPMIYRHTDLGVDVLNEFDV